MAHKYKVGDMVRFIDGNGMPLRFRNKIATITKIIPLSRGSRHLKYKVSFNKKDFVGEEATYSSDYFIGWKVYESELELTGKQLEFNF